MPTLDELYAEYGRPDPVPPKQALDTLLNAGHSVGDVDPDTVQAFLYYGRDMADAFTNGGQSEPGRQFLGLAESPAGMGHDCWIGAYRVTMPDDQDALRDRNRFPGR